MSIKKENTKESMSLAKKTSNTIGMKLFERLS